MPPARILVVDDDEWILRMVSTVLRSEKYELMTASNGEEGLATAQSTRPDLIILDVMMPKMDGWTFIKQLRSMPEFGFVPVIFLTALDSSKDRVLGFRLGADDYLPKPFQAEELVVRVATAMRRRKAMESGLRTQAGFAARGRAGFHGRLEQVGLPSLLTMLDLERKSGVMEIVRADPVEKGRIFLRDGVVVHANLNNDTRKDQGAVYHLLSWSGGTFEFTECSVDINDQVNQPTMHLLMEGARRLDEGMRASDKPASR
ncbi:MAG TPA: response regulator [Planctomycetota bacterium]|nr:response regulator [Planctomycetota bacterium]